jgi:hypothetical protein
MIWEPLSRQLSTARGLVDYKEGKRKRKRRSRIIESF